MTIKEAFNLVPGCNVEAEARITCIAVYHDDGYSHGWRHVYVKVVDTIVKVFSASRGGWIKPEPDVHRFRIPKTVLDISQASAFDNIELLPGPIRSAAMIKRGPETHATT